MKVVASELFLLLAMVASLGASVSAGFFSDKSEPERDPVCSLPLRKGSGCEELQRFHYNRRKDQCVPFVYKGSGGNGNNFNSMGECVEACHPEGKERRCPVAKLAHYLAEFNHKHNRRPTEPPPPPTPDPVCRLPKAAGNGSESLARVYYDCATDSCECLRFSGCGGNGNNFMTMAECEQRCHPKNPSSGGECKDERCLLPKDSGSGSEYNPSYYYDAAQNKCISFVFLGTGGNGNRFSSIEACEQLCKTDAAP